MERVTHLSVGVSAKGGRRDSIDAQLAQQIYAASDIFLMPSAWCVLSSDGDALRDVVDVHAVGGLRTRSFRTIATDQGTGLA